MWNLVQILNLQKHLSLIPKFRHPEKYYKQDFFPFSLKQNDVLQNGRIESKLDLLSPSYLKENFLGHLFAFFDSNL